MTAVNILTVRDQSVSAIGAEVEVRQPDAVLLFSKDRDAIEVICELRNIPQLRHIPIAIMDSRSAESALDDASIRIARRLRTLVPLREDGKPSHEQVRIDQRAREITYLGRRMTCSPLEFRLLLVFLRYPGIVFSRAELLRRTSVSATEVDPRIVDVLIRRLRLKLEGRLGTPSCLLTLRGMGYFFRSAHHQEFVDVITREPFRSWSCCP